MKRINERLGIPIVTACVLLGAGAAHADAVTDWNKIMQVTVSQANAPFQARYAAIVQLAVYEAVNAIVKEYKPYLGTVRAPHRSSPDAAAVAAAYCTLVALFPGSAAALDAFRDQSLAAIPDGRAKYNGIAVGQGAASAILALRANDGASAANVPYTPGTAPGSWQPTPPAFASAVLTGWGRVRTFGIRDGAQFRSGPPPALHTGRYAKDYNEVKAVGALIGAMRPPELTNVANFYAAVLAVQLWNEAARQASAAQRKTLSQNARDFALLAMALADSLISVFETKYHYNFWRPVTAIRAGDTDGNRRTDPDPTWLPLIFLPPQSPAFPSYPSAHASSSYAARRVLESVYGENHLAITLASPLVPGVVLNYTAWRQITDDIDDARIYGGIHFRFDQEAGALQGRQVGSYILRNHLRPVHGGDDE